MSKLRVLHVTPHLGGGVGRCLSTLNNVKDDHVSREFLLLEPPKDLQFFNLIQQKSAIGIIDYNNELKHYLSSFDIVQIEFWNHPAVMHFLNWTKDISLIRIFWCHISGLGPVRLPEGLLDNHRHLGAKGTHNIVVTSNITNLGYGTRFPVINSGFVFDRVETASPFAVRPYDCLFVGQLDYLKLHPEFTHIIQGVAKLSNTAFNVIGTGSDEAQIIDACTSEQILFHGYRSETKTYYRQSKFFIYPLNPNHYGTGENVIKEAMSAGCIPLLLANAAERDIMKEFADKVCFKSKDALIARLKNLLDNPAETEKLSHALTEFALEHYTAQKSARLLNQFYEKLLREQGPIIFNMEQTFGSHPHRWHEIFTNKSHKAGSENGKALSKGSRAHFEAFFKQDQQTLGMQYDQDV